MVVVVQDPDFDLSRHVRYVENKNGGPMSREDMLAFLSTVINTPPPLDRPPWEILVSGHPPTAARRASVAALLLTGCCCWWCGCCCRSHRTSMAET